MSSIRSNKPAIIVFTLASAALAACSQDDDEATPVATCADLQSLKDDGALQAGVTYGVPGVFSFEITSLTSGGQAELDACKALEGKLQGLLTAGAPGATLRYQTPTYTFMASRGMANTTSGEPMHTDGLFRIASASKTYVGALAALMAVEGKLDLDNKDGHHSLADYLPETADKIQYAERITVRQLLNMTSGVPDYFGGLGPVWIQLVLERYHEGKGVSEDDALNLVYGKPADFEPGTSAAYSNTGYVLATHIMTKVLGRPYQDEMRARFFAPLGIANTYWEKHDRLDPTRLAHGYRDAAEIGESFSDWTHVDQGYGFANGGIISRIEDVALFFRAVVGGEGKIAGMDLAALETEQRSTEDGYGLGLVKTGDCYFHGGEFSGYLTGAFHCDGKRSTGVIFVTTSTPAADERLLELLGELQAW